MLPPSGASVDWDRRSSGDNCTRIDYVFANQKARSLVTDFALLRDRPTKQHLGLLVTLGLNPATNTARRMRAVVPYPTKQPSLDPDELHALGDVMLKVPDTSGGGARGPLSPPCSAGTGRTQGHVPIQYFE